MLLQLQRYNLKVKYIKGSTQYIADLLSRAIPPNSVPDAESKSFDVFCLGLDNISLGLDNISHAEYTSVSRNSQAEIKVATENDPALQLLKATVMKGWPDSKEETPAMIQEYWNFREEITIQDGILYKGLHMIIPVSLREDMMKKLHTSHVGTEVCIRKASDSLFWSGL